MQLLENQWYPILESRELGRRKPLGVERLGRQMVLWRSSDGSAHAHLDRCPHLSTALSKGQICNDRLVCPFHGFEFDRQGQCTHIPANGRQGRVPKGFEVDTFVLNEAHGLIWCWSGQPQASYPPVPFFPELVNGWRYGTVTATWPVHYTRAIENQLDVAHLAFVHKTTIGAGGRSFVDGPYVESDAQGLRVWVNNQRDEGQPHRSQAELAEAARHTPPSLQLLYPGVWLLTIAPEFKNLIAFVPINAQTTRYYLRVYHRTRNPLLAKTFETLMGVSNRFILNQDRRVVISQTPRDSSEAHDEKFIGADRAILQFRKAYARLLPGAGERELPQAGENSAALATVGTQEEPERPQEMLS
ncbi:MAG: Rieske 2Fe-2S domain-containing protein [Candidatus Sericytochromatia bacterium]